MADCNFMSDSSSEDESKKKEVQTYNSTDSSDYEEETSENKIDGNLIFLTLYLNY